MSDTQRFYAIGVSRVAEKPLDVVEWLDATDHPLDNSEAAHTRGLATSAPDTTFEAALANAMLAQEAVMGTMDFVIVERVGDQIVSFYAVDRVLPDGLVGIMIQVVQLSERGDLAGKMIAQAIVERIMKIIDETLAAREQDEHRASRA